MVYDEDEDRYYDSRSPRRKKTKKEIAYQKARIKPKYAEDYFDSFADL